MNVVLFGIIVYILLQLLLGYFVSKSIRTEDDYLLAGRRLGYGLATFSIFATWFGAESCIGTAGAAYSDGLAGVSADPFGYGVCLILMGLLFAIPLWKMNLTTIADFFRLRFSGSAERITAILMVPTSLLWAAAQIRAFGQVLSASSELGVTIAVTIAAVVVIAYTVSGGMLADAITDIVQGSILVLGLAFLFPIVINDLGGISEAFSTIGKEALSEDCRSMGDPDLWLADCAGTCLPGHSIAIAAGRPAVFVGRRRYVYPRRIDTALYRTLGSQGDSRT